jgi:hypothetical protein
LNDASSSPINSASSNGVINSSLFNRNNNINISNINMDIQTNDAQGVAYGLRAELNKYFTSQTEQASANSADNVYV